MPYEHTSECSVEKVPRVLILSAHAGAQYWTELCSTIERDGRLDLEYCYGFSDKTYRARRGRIGRAVLYALTYIVFPCRCLGKLLFSRNRWGAVLAVSSPFFLPSLCAAVSRTPVVALMNDIYPEAFYVQGWAKRDSIAASILRAVCRIAVARCCRLVFITSNHRDISERELGEPSRTTIIPVGGPAVFGEKTPRSTGPLYLLYCGTLGRMHDTKTVLDYFSKETPSSKCRFGFRISGSEALSFCAEIERIEDARPEWRDLINVGGGLSDEAWVREMASAHVGMVFQRKGAENVVFPSKTYSILMAGQAVLAITPPGSELARLINEHDCGWVVEPGDTSRLADAIGEALDSRILERKRTNAWVLGHREYSVRELARRWTEVLLNDSTAPDRGGKTSHAV